MATKTKSGFDEKRLSLVLLDYQMLLKAGAYDKETLDKIIRESKKAIEDTTVQSNKDAARRVLDMATEAAAK